MTQTLAEVGRGVKEWELLVAHYYELLMWTWQILLIPENNLNAMEFLWDVDIGQGRKHVWRQRCRKVKCFLFVPSTNLTFH